MDTKQDVTFREVVIRLSSLKDTAAEIFVVDLRSRDNCGLKSQLAYAVVFPSPRQGFQMTCP